MKLIMEVVLSKVNGGKAGHHHKRQLASPSLGKWHAAVAFHGEGIGG
jgi:hypothetical protein